MQCNGMGYARVTEDGMQQHGSKYFVRILSPGGEVQILLFHHMVMLHVKLNRITNATTWKQIVCLKTPSLDPGVKKCRSCCRNSSFSEHGRVKLHIKLNDKNAAMCQQICCRQTPSAPQVNGITNAATW